MEIWIVLIGFIAIILTRSAYRLLNPEFTNTDAFAHFNIIREIRKNRYKIPESHSRTFLPGKFSYPPAIHLVLSTLPERYLESVDRIFSTVIDLLFATLLFTLVSVDILNITQLTVVLALFVATPQFVRPDHPHGVGLSARKPGVFLFSTGMVAFLLWVSGGEMEFLFISITAGALLPLTSRFSTQAFFFVALSLSIFYSPFAIIYFILSLFLSFALSGGYYYRVLRAHVLFSADFARTKQYKFLHDGLKSVDTIKKFITGIKNGSAKGVLEALFDSILLRSLFDNPFVISTIVAVSLSDSVTFPQGYLIWIYAGLGMYLLTSVYHLRFLGHAGRYLEHIFVPAAVVVASVFGERSILFDLSVYLIIIIGLATIGVYVVIQQQWNDTAERDAFASLVEQLQKLPTGRVLVQPRYKGSEIAWKTDHAVNDFLGDGFNTSEAIAKRNRLYPEKEGWVTDNTMWLSSEFDPDWVIFDRQIAGNSPQNGLTEPDRDPYWESTAYALYRFESFEEGGTV